MWQVEAGEESSTGASGATAAAGIDWGPVDHQLHEELKEKRESNAKYKKMLVRDSTWPVRC